MRKEDFIQSIQAGYTFKGDCVQLGAGMLDGEVIS